MPTWHGLRLAVANLFLWPFYALGFVVGFVVKTAVSAYQAIIIGFEDGRT